MNQKELLAKVSREKRIPMNETLFARSDDDIVEELKKVILLL